MLLILGKYSPKSLHLSYSSHIIVSISKYANNIFHFLLDLHRISWTYFAIILYFPPPGVRMLYCLFSVHSA